MECLSTSRGTRGSKRYVTDEQDTFLLLQTPVYRWGIVILQLWVGEKIVA